MGASGTSHVSYYPKLRRAFNMAGVGVALLPSPVSAWVWYPPIGPAPLLVLYNLLVY